MVRFFCFVLRKKRPKRRFGTAQNSSTTSRSLSVCEILRSTTWKQTSRSKRNISKWTDGHEPEYRLSVVWWLFPTLERIRFPSFLNMYVVNGEYLYSQIENALKYTKLQIQIELYFGNIDYPRRSLLLLTEILFTVWRRQNQETKPSSGDYTAHSLKVLKYAQPSSLSLHKEVIYYSKLSSMYHILLNLLETQ